MQLQWLGLQRTWSVSLNQKLREAHKFLSLLISQLSLEAQQVKEAKHGYNYCKIHMENSLFPAKSYEAMKQCVTGYVVRQSCRSDQKKSEDASHLERMNHNSVNLSVSAGTSSHASPLLSKESPRSCQHYGNDNYQHAQMSFLIPL